MTNEAEKRWDISSGKFVNCARAEKFMEDFSVLCKVHRISISHEDPQGGFILTGFDDGLLEWMNSASIEGLEHE